VLVGEGEITSLSCSTIRPGGTAHRSVHPGPPTDVMHTPRDRRLGLLPFRRDLST
jgi:hypothetical protein